MISLSGQIIPGFGRMSGPPLKGGLCHVWVLGLGGSFVHHRDSSGIAQIVTFSLVWSIGK
jgi:hypothetical protein